MNVSSPLSVDHRLSLAPMLDLSDNHFRTMARFLSHKVLLYTEMVVDKTILYAAEEDRLNRVLAFPAEQKPVVVQLAGSDPQSLAQAAQVCQSFGYDEINLNVGCPSDRVQAGRFGACLMKEPSVVAECLQAMISAVSIPVTIKHRIGVDDLDSFENLVSFVETVKTSGCHTFIIHARKAWLKGLSPSQNRSVPPLDYERVYHLKELFPELTIEINGGIQSLSHTMDHLERVDGCMIGRAVAEQPWLLSRADTLIFGEKSDPCPTRYDLVLKMNGYANTLMDSGTPIGSLLRHLMGLYHGLRNARKWRVALNEVLVESKGERDPILRAWERSNLLQEW